MTDTPQALRPGETVVAPDPLTSAALAFKVALGQAEPAERQRDAQGRFAAAEPETPQAEIEAPDEGGAEAEPEAGAESQDEGVETDEAAEEAQPEAAELPKSWPADKAELWESLEPSAQAYIRQRDAEQETAVNAKFMEAANLRKAHEAEINEAQANRQRYADAVDEVMSLVVPNPPPRSMLDVNSADYDPDAYHYQKATYEDTVAFLQQHAAQRQQIAAQAQSERFGAINNATRDSFIEAVPDVADQAKAPAIFKELMEYAVSLGMPADVFSTPTTAGEWHVLWKAQQYDRLQAAKAQVRTEPKPPPKPAPAVRPGVASPRGAIEAASKAKARDRLAREGSIEAGAAVWKDFL